jgi:hypothetical protein
MSRSNAGAVRTALRAPPPALARNASSGKELFPPSAPRLRLIAVGAASATPAPDRTKVKGKSGAPSPRISVGQTLRAAVVLCVACLSVAFPPPGLRKPTVPTSTVLDGNVDAAAR